MGTFINQLIAGLLANFKVKSPKVWAAIVLILGMIIYFAEQGTLLGVFELSDTLSSIVSIASTILGFLSAPSITAYLPKQQRDPLIEKALEISAKVDATRN